jgi:hypothetical protein
VFFVHLDVEKAPTTHDPAAGTSAISNRAFISLLGLSKVGSFVGDGKYEGAIIKAWPGNSDFSQIMKIKIITVGQQVYSNGVPSFSLSVPCLLLKGLKVDVPAWM